MGIYAIILWRQDLFDRCETRTDLTYPSENKILGMILQAPVYALMLHLAVIFGGVSFRTHCK